VDAAVSAGVLERPPDGLRAAVREQLTAHPAFPTLQAGDRLAIANSLVRIAHAARLLENEAAAEPAPAKRRAPPTSRAMNAGDEMSGRAVASMAGTTRNMINAISFPRFVNELITGVFKAMVETNQQQLQQYVELVRGVSQSLEGFSALGGGSDDMAKRWLAEQFPASYAIEEPDPDDRPDPEDGPEPLQLITRGSAPSADALRAALNLEPGTEIPATSGPELLAFVRRSLARNRQQMLATMVQMGMQRIVVDSGRISASMRFHIDASSAAAEQRHTGFDTRTTIGASASASFGWWSASASVNSTIGYVSTTDTQTKEEVNASADLTSSVELHFRTDQVPLDRIASQQTVQRLKLNTLNPERELQIAAETDRARIGANQAMDTARAAHPQSPPAPTPGGATGGGTSGGGSTVGGTTGGGATSGRPTGGGTTSGGTTGGGATGGGTTGGGTTSGGTTGGGTTGGGTTGGGTTGGGTTGGGTTGGGTTGGGTTGSGTTGSGTTGGGTTGGGTTSGGTTGGGTTTGGGAFTGGGGTTGGGSGGNSFRSA
jgi:hypothetical protein